MSLPDIPNERASNFEARVREALQTLMGFRGDKLDRALTLRDALANGLLTLRPGGQIGTGSGPWPGSPGGGGDAYEPDLTPPPSPGSLTATSAISHVILEVPPATYTQGHGHLQTRIYAVNPTPANPNPTFSDAVEVGRFEGTVWAMPSNPATSWRFWAKWETRDGVLSVNPTGGANGVAARTGEDVALLLEALTGQITASELASSLSTPISLIDQPTTGILARLDAQRAAIDSVQTEVAALSGTPDYDAAATYELDNIVKFAGGLYRALGTTTGNAPSNPTYWQKIGDYASLGDAVASHAVTLDNHNTRITANESGLLAEASSRNTLAAQLRGTYTGTDVAALSSGLVYSEHQARVTAVAAEASSRNTLQTKLIGAANPATATLAGLSAGLIFDERQARSTAVSSAVTRIDGLEATVNNATTGVLATANALDVVELLVNNSETGVTATANKTSLLQSKLRNPSVLPSTFLAGMDDWTGSRGGSPAAVSTYSATIVTDDPDFGTCARITNMASAGANILTKGVLPCIPGKTYRVMAQFKVETVPTDGGVQMNCVIPHLSETYANATTTFGDNTAVITAPGIYTAEARISDVSAPGVFAWAAGTKYVRFGLRLAANESGLVIRVRSILVEDITEARALSASIQTESTTRATQTGELYAQYTVKTDVGGLISGYGLASTANNAAPTSAFGIQAGQFFVAPPTVNQATAPTANLYKGFVWRNSTTGLVQYWTGTAWSTTPQTLPFVVQAVPTTINGVAVPAGMYAESAFIMNGTITNAKIANLAVDDAKVANLSAAKLTAGSIAVGQYIQGTGYVAGSASWRINGDGTAEFNNVTVRGTVFATAGQIGGITIASNAVRAGQTAYNTGSGFHLGSDGRLSLGNSSGNRLTWDGTNLNVVGGGTFSGALSAATGTFNGNVSGGQFTTGAYTGYAWPAVNNFGSYLGPSGLLLGNANNGRYFQVTHDGQIYAPNFSIVNGVLTISQANVINTLNIAGNAVTFPAGAERTTNLSVSTSNVTVLSVTMDSKGSPVWITGSVNNASGFTVSMTVELLVDGAVVKSTTGDGSFGVFYNTYLPSSPSAPHSIAILARVAAGTGTGTISNAVIFAIGTKR